jgi:hypothetical protein
MAHPRLAKIAVRLPFNAADAARFPVAATPDFRFNPAT